MKGLYFSVCAWHKRFLIMGSTFGCEHNAVMTHLQMQNDLLKESQVIMTCTTMIQDESCLSLNMAQIKMKNP